MKVPLGFLLSSCCSGIKKQQEDLGMIFSEDLSLAVGVFTENKNSSYSVQLSRKNIKYPFKALVVNSGNANCFSHPNGLLDTLSLAQAIADFLSVKEQNILIASTGIIGQKLPFEKIKKSIPILKTSLGRSRKHILGFAKAILTTDTKRKIVYNSLKLKSGQVNILGFAKGAGMIQPNMATMLGFILTDVNCSYQELSQMLKTSVANSFNSISIDGCMSTNDSVYLLTSQLGPKLKAKEKKLFFNLLADTCKQLALKIVEDGEGVTKVVELIIEQAYNKEEAQRAAYAIANSLLFKTALYGANPNWGRIIAALGQADIPVKEEVFKVESSPLNKSKVKIKVSLGRGKTSYTLYTNDLSIEYVKINSEYS